jgi:hypothetical protein
MRQIHLRAGGVGGLAGGRGGCGPPASLERPDVVNPILLAFVP